MIDATRLRDLMKERGFSQSRLAREVGVSQSAIHKLASGGAYGSQHLHRIAGVLGTTTDYLEGAIDDPDEGAPSPMPARPPRILMEVRLPGEEALADMFERLLLGIDRAKPVAEQARLLAERLPLGLSQLRDLRPAMPSGAPASAKGPGQLATHDREPQR